MATLSTPQVQGVHHISIQAQGLQQMERTVAFYHEGLGMPILRRWGRLFLCASPFSGGPPVKGWS